MVRIKSDQLVVCFVMLKLSAGDVLSYWPHHREVTPHVPHLEYDLTNSFSCVCGSGAASQDWACFASIYICIKQPPSLPSSGEKSGC